MFNKLAHTMSFRQNPLVILIGMAFLVAGIIGWHRLTYTTVWYDEYLTIQTIRLDWRTIVHGDYPRELHPPLYFLMLKLWTSIFGPYEIAMRLFSLLFTLINIILIAILTRQMAGWRVATAMTLLFTLHPLHIYHSVMIRMYPFWLFCCLLALLAYFRYTAADKPRIAWLLIMGLALTASMYTQYLGVLMALTLGLFSLIQWIARRDKRQYSVIATVILSGLFYIPCIIYILGEQVQYYAAQKAPVSTLVDARMFLTVLSGSTTWIIQLFALLAFLGGFFLLLRNGQNILAWQCLLSIAVSVVFLVFVNIQGMQLAPRYLLHINVLASFFIAATVGAAHALPATGVMMESTHVQATRKTGFLINLLGIAFIVVFIIQGINNELPQQYASRDTHPNWQQVAEVINTQSLPGEDLVIMGWDATPVEFYLLDRPTLSSYELEQHLLQQNQHPSYIILDSKYARQLPFLTTSQVLYEVPEWQVRVMRWPAGEH